MNWYLYKCPECGTYFISSFDQFSKVIECTSCGYDVKFPICLGLVGGVPEQEAQP